MNNFVEQLMALEENRGDAVLLQPYKPGSNGAPSYHTAQCIVRRIRTQGGDQWAVHPLMRGRTGSGMYSHDMNAILAFAEKWYDGKSSLMEAVMCEYSDSDYPANLIPM